MLGGSMIQNHKALFIYLKVIWLSLCISTDALKLRALSPLLVHEELKDFRCPSQALSEDDIVVFEPQLKPEFKFKTRKIKEVTNSHWIQLCFKTFREVDYVEKHPYSITLAIFTNRARLWNLKSISNVWKGQISLAYLVSKKHKRRDLNHLSSLIKTSKDLSDRLQVHLVYAKYDDEAFPINLLRNVASIGIQSSHTFHMDIDFVPSRNLFSYLGSQDIIGLLREISQDNRRLLLVVPAFETNSEIETDYTLGLDDSVESMASKEVKNCLRRNLITSFHVQCEHCQAATNISLWIDADEPYLVSKDAPLGYEPFVISPSFIMKNETKLPFLLWDEIFTGYGRDKTIYFHQLRLFFGYEFLVLPNVFIYHKRHEKSQDAFLWQNIDLRKQRKKMFARRMNWWEQKLGYTSEDMMLSIEEVNKLAVGRTAKIYRRASKPIPLFYRAETTEKTAAQPISRKVSDLEVPAENSKPPEVSKCFISKLQVIMTITISLLAISAIMSYNKKLTKNYCILAFIVLFQMILLVLPLIKNCL